VLGYTTEILAVLASILGGAFIVRAFDIDRAWAKWTKPTPAGFVRIFTFIAGAILILSSIPAGIAQVETPVDVGDAWLINAITNQTIVGQFASGALPILWIGLGSIFAGTLLSNWMTDNRSQFIDLLRLIVLGALYPTVFQFVGTLLHDESSFTLVPPLLIGLAITLVSATVLFRKFKRHKVESADAEDSSQD
jgi:putative membrane protein